MGHAEIWGRTSSINVQKVMWAVASSGSRMSGSMPAARSAVWTGPTTGHEPQPPDPGLAGRRDRLGSPIRSCATSPRTTAPATLAGGRLAALGGRPLDGLAANHAAAGDRADLSGPDPHPSEKRDMALITASAERLGQAMTILDGHLATRPYVAGDALTMGDIPVGFVCWALGQPRHRPPRPAQHRRLPRPAPQPAPATVRMLCCRWCALSPRRIVMTGGWPARCSR